MIHYKQASTNRELKEILALQKDNLVANLNENEKLVEGFVTIEHNLDLLKEMNELFPHTIAIHNNRVIGYALSMHPKLKDKIPFFKTDVLPDFDLLHRTRIYSNGASICVAKAYRQKGVFRALYQHLFSSISPSFKAIITEVSLKNKRSLAAHLAIGFKEIIQHKSNGGDWSIIVMEGG